jgi:hypothetical protein
MSQDQRVRIYNPKRLYFLTIFDDNPQAWVK